MHSRQTALMKSTHLLHPICLFTCLCGVFLITSTVSCYIPPSAGAASSSLHRVHSAAIGTENQDGIGVDHGNEKSDASVKKSSDTAALATAGQATPNVAAAMKEAGCPDSDQKILTAMHAEMERSRNRLGDDKIERPYFISYALRTSRNYNLRGKFGAVFSDSTSDQNSLGVDVRVGDYEFDSSGVESFDLDRIPDYFPEEVAPIEANETALRTSLWLLTDYKYKEAVAAYGRKKGHRIFRIEDEKAPSFSIEEQVVHCATGEGMPFDSVRHQSVVKELSAMFLAHPEFFDSEAAILANQEVLYLVTSEGTLMTRARTLYTITAGAMTRADDGMLLEASFAEYASSEEELSNNLEKYRAKTAKVITDLLALRKAPVIDPYTGPAILAPEATGVFFHETIGHRLEGERQDNDAEGRTFKGRVGKQIIPDFISLIDDPTMATYMDTPLNGYFLYDDEGVRSRKVTLIDNGVLKGFLMGRRPIKDFTSSTGHGRAQGTNKPTARMGNLMVQSEKQLPYKDLEKKLLELARNAGKPYGLLIQDMSGGSTNTAAYGYQAFKGTPNMVYRIDVKTGKKELVRGVEMVGTPLTAINSIMATGDKSEVFNGFCGAESGYIPVSVIAPATLFREIELQRVKSSKERGPLLMPPAFERGAGQNASGKNFGEQTEGEQAIKSQP